MLQVDDGAGVIADKRYSRALMLLLFFFSTQALFLVLKDLVKKPKLLMMLVGFVISGAGF